MSKANAYEDAIPVCIAFDRLGIGYVTGQGLVNSGELETFLIGRRRYTTPAAIQRFIGKRLDEAKAETPEERAARVGPAVAARARKREEFAERFLTPIELASRRRK